MSCALEHKNLRVAKKLVDVYFTDLFGMECLNIMVENNDSCTMQMWLKHLGARQDYESVVCMLAKSIQLGQRNCVVVLLEHLRLHHRLIDGSLFLRGFCKHINREKVEICKYLLEWVEPAVEVDENFIVHIMNKRETGTGNLW